MPDVTVEFGAKDAGLSQTLKNVQKELAELDTQQRTTAMSADEFQKTLSRTKQLEGMEKKLRSMGDAASDTAPKIDRLGKELQDVGNKSENAGGLFDSSFAKITGAFTLGNVAAAGFNKAIDLAFSGAQIMAQGFGDALDLGGRLNELSARTGEAAGKLLVLETAFKNAGLGAEMVGTVINKLQNFMQDAANGGDKQATAMTDLGISLAELKGKTPTEQMKVFADKIAAIEDPTQRAAMASEVFGDKLGGKLLPLLIGFSPALDDARGKVGSLERVMNESAATFDSAGETIDAVKGKLVAFAAGVLNPVIPAVSGLGEEVAKVDFASFGKLVGEVLVQDIENFKNATTGLSAAFKTLNSGLEKIAAKVVPVDNAVQKVGDSTEVLYNLFEKARVYSSPLGIALDLLTTHGEKLRSSQKDVGTTVATSTEKIEELGEKAKETGAEIGLAFNLNSDFKPAIEGISSAWSNFNSEITGTTPLLESNYSYADSIAGKIDEQTQGVGGLNKQLDLSKNLEEQINNIKTVRAKKEEEAAAKQAERQSDLRENLELDLQSLKAKISGNEQEQKALQYKKDYNAALKQAIDAGMGQPQAKSFADEIARARQEQAGMNTELSTSAKLLQAIAQAEGKKGTGISRLEERGQKQIEKGQFQAAKRTAEQIQNKEVEADIRGAGRTKDRRSMADIGKDFGLSQQMGETGSEFAKRVKDVKEGKATPEKFGKSKPLAEKPSVDKPGKDGKTKEDMGKDKSMSLETLVLEIKNLVAKIEPKLPQQALA
jgi:hypothetical protein